MSSGRKKQNNSGSKAEEGSKLVHARRKMISNLVTKHDGVFSEPIPENLQRLIERMKENERKKSNKD